MTYAQLADFVWFAETGTGLPAASGGPKTIYAAACRLGAPRLQREQIVFKQTPYALAV